MERLRVDEGMTASAIAEKIGAPFDVVAQQLIDALLLPAIELPPEKTGSDISSPDAAGLAIAEVLDSVGDTCPECPPGD